MLQIAYSEASLNYLKLFNEVGVLAHPARYPAKLPEFFIRMLTEPDDIDWTYFQFQTPLVLHVK